MFPLPVRPRTFRQTTSRLLRVGIPAILVYLCQMIVELISIAFCGNKLGPDALAGASLAAIALNLSSLAAATGICTAVDTLCSQARGRLDSKMNLLSAPDIVPLSGAGFFRGSIPDLARLGSPLKKVPSELPAYCKQALGCALGCSVVCGFAVWTFTGSALLGLGQDPVVTSHAVAYLRAAVFGMAAQSAGEVLRHYLTITESTLPSSVAVVSSVVLHPLLLYVCMSGDGGIRGAGIGWALSQWINLSILVCLAPRYTLKDLCGRPGDFLRGWHDIVALALPAIGTIVLDWGSLELVSLAAGVLGAEELAAHAVLSSTVSTVFALGLGIADGAGVLVGEAVGRGDFNSAYETAWIAVSAVVCGTVWASLMLFLGGESWISLFTEDSGVVAIAKAALPFVALYVILDGVQCVGGGVLRGFGQQNLSLRVSLISFCGLGLPCAFFLGFWVATPLGILGLWAGEVIGLAVAATLSLSFFQQEMETLRMSS